MAVKHFQQFHMNFMTHFDWGCKDKDHRAYATIEAESHAHALMSVPPAFRAKARAIRVVKFTREGVDKEVKTQEAHKGK